MAAFVGRAAELKALVDAAEVSEGGGPTAALVVGDPGSGKSRLIAEAAQRVDVAHRLRVIGYEPEAAVPLAATGGLLRALFGVPEHGPRLEALLLGAPTESPLESVRIFEAAQRALHVLTPALLVIDDLQWVDERSRALCHYLVRAALERGDRLIVFSATRIERGGLAFHESIAQALSVQRVTMLELEGLSREDGIQLARSVAPGLDTESAEAVWEQAGGLPFWLQALAAAADKGDDPGRLVAASLRGVGAEAIGLLGLLAVAGRPLALPYAAALADVPVDRTERLATELVERGLLLAGAGTLRVAHDLIRSSVTAELPEQTRRAMHRRLGEWLEADAHDDLKLLREALEHRRAGGAESLGLASRLARSPRRTLLDDEGLALLTEIADDADPSLERVQDLNERLAVLASELGNHRAALERWTLLADRTAEPGRRNAALLGISRALYELGRGEEALETLQRARDQAPPGDVATLEMDVHEAAIHLWLRQRTDEGRGLAEAVGQRARLLAAHAGGPEKLDGRALRAYIDALRAEHEAAMQADDPLAMLVAAEDWAAAAAGFDEEAQLAGSIRAAVALSLMGRLFEAEERIRHIWNDAQRRVLPRQMLDAAYWLGKILVERGRLGEAEQIADEVARLAARVGDVPRGRNRVSRLISNVALHRHNSSEEVGRLAAVAVAEPSRHLQIGLYEDLALWVARLHGASAETQVVEHLEAARSSAEVARCPRCSGELLLIAAEGAARVGRYDEASERLREWDELPKRPKPHEQFIRQRVGALLQAHSNPDRAVVELEQAGAHAQRLEFVVEAVWTKLDEAEALARFDRARAAEALRAAAAAADKTGSRTQTAVAEQRLRALGVRTWRRGRASGEEDPLSRLTDREREVAKLAAGGASNPEIAEALFLSRKTVERHVSNVLAKLGVRNRAQLAAALTRPPEGGGS